MVGVEMNQEWPKTVKVGGREYELHPDMPIHEFIEAVKSFNNEAEKLSELGDMMGMRKKDD